MRAAQRRAQDSQVAVALDTPETLLGLQEPGGTPAQRHVRIAPATDFRGDLAHVLMPRAASEPSRSLATGQPDAVANQALDKYG